MHNGKICSSPSDISTPKIWLTHFSSNPSIPNGVSPPYPTGRHTPISGKSGYDKFVKFVEGSEKHVFSLVIIIVIASHSHLQNGGSCSVANKPNAPISRYFSFETGQCRKIVRKKPAVSFVTTIITAAYMDSSVFYSLHNTFRLLGFSYYMPLL